MSKLLVLILTAGFGASCFSQTAAPRDAEVERLLERIAVGDGVDAADATDELLALITGPLDAALDAFEAGSLDRQRRVRQALSRLTARIRARLFRAGLPPDERKQLDRFAALSQPLIDQLFSDDPARRIAAIGRIPVEIGSGAGVAATAGIYDHDENVVKAAFESCGEFAGDESVGKSVTRFIDESIEAHQAGRYVNADEANDLVVQIGEAIRVLGRLKYAPGVTSVVRAVRLYTKSGFRVYLFAGLGNSSDRSQPIHALGRIGDPRAAPLLISLLANEDVTAAKGLVPKRLLQRTLGDEALMSLLMIFKLDPREYGVIISADARRIAGFVEDKNRKDARNKFKAWYRAHLAKQKSGPDAPASKPSDGG